MSTDLQDLADRLDIQAALHHYAFGLDERRWEAWDLAFTEDAVIDFSPMGGKREQVSGMRERLSRSDDSRLFGQHPVTNTIIEVDGDTAVAHSEYTVETGRRGADPGTVARMSGGGRYEDTLRRTPVGWRIELRLVFLKWKRTSVERDEVERDA